MEQTVSSFETFGQGHEDAASVLMIKEKNNIEDGIEMKEIKPVRLEFLQLDKLLTPMSEITSNDRLEVEDNQISKPKTRERQEHRFSFLDISSTTKKKTTNAGSSFFSGCTFMPNGELVVCDIDNSSVKVFTLDFKLKNDLTIGSNVWDVAVVSQTEVIVTKPHSKSLQFLIVSSGIEKGKSISIGMYCWGIDCKNDRVYVSCHENNGKGGVVKVLTMDGVTVNTFAIRQDIPNYLDVDKSGERILVSTSGYGVVCLDNTGNTLYTHAVCQLIRSRGLLLDSYGNFMVCGKSTNNIHVVKSDGTQHRILLTENDGLFSPVCLTYRPSDNTLIIGQLGNQALLAFTIG